MSAMQTKNKKIKKILLPPFTQELEFSILLTPRTLGRCHSCESRNPDFL